MSEDVEVVTVDRYIAVTPGQYGGGFYGAGGTVEEARANLKKVGGNLNRVIVWQLPEGAHSAFISCFGQIHWTWVSDEFRDAWDGSELPVVQMRGVR